MPFHEISAKTSFVEDVELHQMQVKYCKMRIILNILKESSKNSMISSNKTLKNYFLLDFLPKIHPCVTLPKQIRERISTLPAKECLILRNHVHQQIPVICEPLLKVSRSTLKQHPEIFDKSFTHVELIDSLVERRRATISSLLEAKKRKLHLLMQLIERRLAPGNVTDLETMLLKFQMREQKVIGMDKSILQSMETEESQALAAYREIEKHLDELLHSRGLAINYLSQ
ncbi:uncharacterized protein LOC132257993 [Phlebotomus argentipes]|uniref:uncharacterized protein LOC132257993 n=1 Tax=Phlebotomus argentipes TaxID=94469 RepID=UPI0028938305|nr:uncharacterized protein LOC132257993 [Phlebotomus argentipes]